MDELKCDLMVDQIKITEKADEDVFTAVLSGETIIDMEAIDVKVTAKCGDREVLKKLGIDEVGNKKTVKMTNTNSRLDSFVPVDEDMDIGV